MAVPIRHADCGEIVMWYFGDKVNNLFSSRDVLYLDGSRPLCGSRVPLCPHCGLAMRPANVFGGLFGGKVNLTRCFDEDIDPGFATRINDAGIGPNVELSGHQRPRTEG